MRAKRLCRGVVVLALLAAQAAPALAAPAGSTLLVSRPDGLGPVPPAFDNRSDTPGALSSDGRYAVFTSDADGFAAGIDAAASSVLLRDTLTGTTTLVSRSDGPLGVAANRDAENAVVAVAPAGTMPDAPLGQPHVLVAFETSAQNLVDHASGTLVSTPVFHERVWLRDVTAGTTYLVSKADGAAGAPSDNSANDPALDVGPAGPVVAFRSIASNLGANAGGIFLRTLNAADTQLISCRNNNCGTPSSPTSAANPDVRVVAPNNATLCTTVAHPTGCVLVAFDTADTTITNDPAGRSQIAVALADAGTTNTGIPTSLFLMSRPNGSGTLLGDGDSTQPSFNGDGRAIAFLSTSANLTLDALPASPQQAYLRSLTSATTRLLSRADGAGAAADGPVFSVSLGGDAAQPRAAFAATAANLGIGLSTNVYVRSDATQRTELLNRAAGAAGAPGDSNSGARPAMSADGSTALFASAAHNLGEDPAPYNRVRVRRLATGAVELVSRPDGTAPFASLTGNSHLQQGAVSDDGRYVAFTSSSKAFSPLADGIRSQVYVRDLSTGRTILASRADGPAGAIADTGAGAQTATISGNGRFVAFTSSAGNLLAGPPAGVNQVYVRDLVAQTTTLVSRANGPTGSPAPRPAGGGTISRDGSVVVFVTSSALDPAGADGNQHVYVRDLGAQTTTLVDRDDGPAGAVATRSGFEAVLDADGSRVAWTTEAPLAGAPADGRLHVLVRDLASGRTVLVSRTDGPGGASADSDSRSPSIDADGDVVAFSSRAPNLGGSPNGQIYVRDLAAGRTQLVSRADGPLGTVAGGTEFAAIDAAGQRVAFSASGDFAGVTTGGPFQIYVRDVPSQTTTLASRADGPAGAPADARTDFLAMSADGNCVAFASPSSNLGDGFASFDFNSIHLRVVRGECAPAPPVVVPPPAPRAIAGPPAVLSRLAVRPRRFHVGGRRGGTTISFTLDKAARVTLAFDRLRAGHRVNRRCRARARRGRRCTIATRVGSFAVNARAGRNAIRFSGRLGRRALARGRHLLTATPAGGRAATVRFTVVAAPRARRGPRARRR